MDLLNSTPKPSHSSQSTFLISRDLINSFDTLKYLKGRVLRDCLHRLLNDPLLNQKLGTLMSGKWKKVYQSDGLDLVPVYFYPDESDWAHLSLLSNGTGFSRCYIFIYLLLFDLGILKLVNDRTKAVFSSRNLHRTIQCLIYLNKPQQKLRRQLKTWPGSQ